MSWTEAGASVLAGATEKGQSTYYIGYNLDMARQFIADCGWWAQQFQVVADEAREYIYEDIITFRVKLASGHQIVALSSRPTNLRGKKGRVVIDEASHHDQLQELIDAAIALLMWGGQVSIISTHYGEDNLFNQLIKQCRAGELNYSLHEISFQNAIADGLYKRICETTGSHYSLETETNWIKEIYGYYGQAALQELDCIPAQLGAGAVFNREWFEIVDSVPEGGITVRFWDLAATARELNKNACYTAGVKIRFVDGIFYVISVLMDQLSPPEGDRLILNTAQQDGRWTLVRWELEGGSAGKRDEYHLQQMLRGYDTAAVRPLGDKVTRAKPLASEAMNGCVKLLRGNWNDRFLDCLSSFPKGIIDPVDAATGAYAAIVERSPRTAISSYRY